MSTGIAEQVTPGMLHNFRLRREVTENMLLVGRAASGAPMDGGVTPSLWAYQPLES